MSEPSDPIAARLAAIQREVAPTTATMSEVAAPELSTESEPAVSSAETVESAPLPEASPWSPESDDLTPDEAALLRAISKLHRAIIELIDPRQPRPDAPWIGEKARNMVANIATSEGIPATPRNRNLLIASVVDEILGYGPLQSLADDALITEIIVNGPRSVWIETGGQLRRTRVAFQDNGHVMRIVQKMLAAAGRRVDEGSPMCDARLPDGSRLNVVVPPIALSGAAMTIRKHGRAKLNLPELVERGTLTEGMSQFLRACVLGKMNILICGGTSSGKTSMLNALAAYIPARERVITIEDSAELQIRHPGLLALQSRPSNTEGVGEVTIRDLVRNALRMRPDRIVVGEVRGGEALDMLQAMLTGHRGSLSTIHGNAPQDSLDRLETMSLMAGVDIPASLLRKQIASAIHLLIQQDRSADGKRRITHITEVIGMHGNDVLLQDIYEFHREGMDDQGQIIGHHFATGLIPLCVQRMSAEGAPVPERSLFERGVAR